MDPERWHRITRIFHDALDRDSAARAAYLAEACGADSALRGDVDALLAGDAAVAIGGDPLALPTRHIAPDDMLGPYRIEKLLGAGGMGEVYKARDTRLPRTVAIKVLPAGLHDAALRQRFEREAQAIASLSHPNVCVLPDVGSHEGIDFLVMEYLDGDSLEARLREGPLAVDDALTIAIQVAMGLEHAHRAGVVHRDLKPGNVMITRSGVKVLDFGLAKFTTRAVCGAPPNLPSTLTAPRPTAGTSPYLAPEPPH